MQISFGQMRVGSVSLKNGQIASRSANMQYKFQFFNGKYHTNSEIVECESGRIAKKWSNAGRLCEYAGTRSFTSCHQLINYNYIKISTFLQCINSIIIQVTTKILFFIRHNSQPLRIQKNNQSPKFYRSMTKIRQMALPSALFIMLPAAGAVPNLPHRPSADQTSRRGRDKN